MLRIAALVASLTLLAVPAAAQTRSLAVTFDDLPYQAADAALCDPKAAMALTNDFLRMLKPLKSNATAFVNEGKVCEAQRPTLLPRIEAAWLDAGVDLGNHTFSHLNIHTTTAEAWLADVDRGEIVTRPLLKARGKTLRYFRHPFLFLGETSEKKAAMAEGLQARGYTVAPVTLDNNDWMFAAVYRQAEAAGDEALKARVGEAYVAHMAAVLDFFEPYSAELTAGREPAQVLLLHASSLNRDWYPKIHALYLARGYRFVTLDEALKDPIYSHAETTVKKAGVSWLHRWTASDGRKVRWEPEPPDWIVTAYKAAS
ncbi:MAG: polysaccharide deacetylase [Caulobacter sp.]|nr:polysaccharide deacetylase [Caulobacter sp.]